MSKRLFVGNLSWNTSETQLRAAFEPYGVTDVTIPAGHDGRAKGFGFVEISADKMNEAIAAMNGRDLDGRTLTVNEARPREERSGGGGYGGGGGSRGGNRGGGGYGGGDNRW